MPRFFPTLQNIVLLVSAIFAAQSVQPAVADELEPARRALDVEVLIQSQPSYRIKSQEWGRVFQELGYSVRFREPRAGEAPRVEDMDREDFVATRVVAAMAADGSIRIGSQKFDIERTKPLTLALEEIQRYGAKGPPDSSPTWGLTDEQFKEVTRLLGVPVDNPVELQSSILAVESVGLPANMRMKFTEAARQPALAQRPESAPETIALQGFTKGSAIAIILAQYGLGFRPRYVAPGQYDMEIDRGDESTNLWPIGWKPEQSFSEILPAYFRAIPLDVEDVEVSSLVGAISDKIGVPAFSSAYALTAKQLNIHILKYTRRDDRISPARLLTAVGDKLELGFDIRVDEAGKMFLWVTTADDAKAFRHRFAHVKQK
ncbi:MAG: hypothetical protein WKF77_24885 [Planctomycetaceae bacterium]